jgi:hypothetical protein
MVHPGGHGLYDPPLSFEKSLLVILQLRFELGFALLKIHLVAIQYRYRGLQSLRVLHRRLDP